MTQGKDISNQVLVLFKKSIFIFSTTSEALPATTTEVSAGVFATLPPTAPEVLRLTTDHDTFVHILKWFWVHFFCNIVGFFIQLWLNFLASVAAGRSSCGRPVASTGSFNAPLPRWFFLRFRVTGSREDRGGRG